MPSAVLRLALFMNIVLSITGFAQVFHEPLGAARLPRMHQVSPCSTGASRIFATSSVNNHTALIGGLGRIGPPSIKTVSPHQKALMPILKNGLAKAVI